MNLVFEKIKNWISNQADLDLFFQSSLKAYLKNWSSFDKESFNEMIDASNPSSYDAGYETITYKIFNNREDDEGRPLEAFILKQRLKSLNDDSIYYYLMISTEGEIIDDGIEVNKA